MSGGRGSSPPETRSRSPPREAYLLRPRIRSISCGRTGPSSGLSPLPHSRCETGSPTSHDRGGDVLDDPVAVPARGLRWLSRPHEEVRLHRLPQVRDAVRVPAPKDPKGPIREPDDVLLGDVVVPDHVHARLRGDKRDLVHLAGAQLPVLHLHDVLPTHRLRGHVHRDGDRGGDALLDPEDLQHLQGHPRGDVVDHGAVLDRRDPELPHPPTPRSISRSAIRTGTALNACRKYFACGVRSTAGSISVTRGSGWSTMRSFFASRRIARSTR